MSRYFFDIHDGQDIRDEIGREFDGDDALRHEALRVTTSLMAAEAAENRETTLMLTVRDGMGGTPLRIRLVCQVEEARPAVADAASGARARLAVCA